MLISTLVAEPGSLPGSQEKRLSISWVPQPALLPPLSDSPEEWRDPNHPSTQGGLEVTRDNFIPLFDNNIKNYKEWRARILLYGKKMSIQNKGKEATINLLTSLTGVFMAPS